jgi:pyruvate kinase
MQHFGYSGVMEPACSYQQAALISKQRRHQLFGEKEEEDIPSIMITFKTSFAYDFITVKKLLKAGMNIARINCAHDDEKTWMKMIRTIREVCEFTGLSCKIYMDLAGPKIRTSLKGKKDKLLVEEEDILLLTDKENLKDKLPIVHCTIPGITRQLKIGERVFFDDGIIEAKVIAIRPDAAEIEIVQVPSKKPYLKAEKGINFPDSKLRLSALSAFDRQCIPFIQEHADMVGFSFIHTADDIIELQQALNGKPLPIILKIETPEALRDLPYLLFTAMRAPLYGLMIARGDLAVEMGFENIGRAQEQIFAFCRAAHVPVIYATQILESMNKNGLPTRAEITDASYGILADCIMLNKGAHTAKVIKALRKIMRDKALEFSNHRPVSRMLQTAKGFLQAVKPEPSPANL